MRGFSATPARCDGAQRSLLYGASMSLAPRFGDQIGNDVGQQLSAKSPWWPPRRSLSTASKVAPATEPVILPDITKRELLASGMPFVDRDDEAIEIANHNISNVYFARTKEIEKPTLVSSSQLFGAGKTAMGANAVARVHNSEVLRKRLVTLLKEILGAKNEATLQQLVDDYANAVTVMIDLSQPHATPHVQSLNAFLVCQLHSTLGQHPKLKDKDAWAKLDPRVTFFSSLLQEFHEQTGRNVFIHIDEVCVSLSHFSFPPKISQVGALVTTQYDQYFSDLPRVVEDPELKEVRRFWNEIKSLLGQHNAYLFVTGKSAGFSLIGLQCYHVWHYAYQLPLPAAWRPVQ